MAVVASVTGHTLSQQLFQFFLLFAFCTLYVGCILMRIFAQNAIKDKNIFVLS